LISGTEETRELNTPFASSETIGQRNPDSQESRATRIFEVPHVDTVRFAGLLTRVFGFAKEYHWTGQNSRQENFGRGLFVNYQYVAKGVANLLVVTTNNVAFEKFMKVLWRMERRPLEAFQGVLA
jgi:hypothetical protein